ncbi:MAG: repressor LexA [Flexistipes sinusarabici]|uniref:Repressor LexA n=1 Tax=Flexistipes sinusarabici TaxID=2352 RepID=A0A5D0MKX2_FLESI|nr:transcriptional repressor LexA [Flexistipes sinusarabici]TYB32565.1 MAG: repressor LexA [Flexistipes sinusarabici]
MGLTNRQKEFFLFIKNFLDEYGYPPSVRDIAKGMGVTSISSVKKMLDRLAEAGIIKKDSSKARGIELINRGVPLLGRIKAGTPVFSEENIEGYVELAEKFKNTQNLFCLKVEGDSMIDKGIFEDDTAVIKKQPDINEGETGAFRINDEVTLKTFARKEGYILLIPANKRYQSIRVTSKDSFEVIGKLIFVLKDFN